MSGATFLSLMLGFCLDISGQGHIPESFLMADFVDRDPLWSHSEEAVGEKPPILKMK